MSTQAQQAANQANAQKSCGPKTETGKATSCFNNFRHGLAGEFMLLENEDPIAYQMLLTELVLEHQPDTATESLLVERMAQHQWLLNRALRLQNKSFGLPDPQDHARSLALYLRYQTTHERAFSKCLNDLAKRRAEKRKAEIGFESQKLAQAEHQRKQSIENRKQDLHKMELWLAEAKAEHQELVNSQLETPETRRGDRVQRIIARSQAA